jgi:cytoskeletal protein RodZ
VHDPSENGERLAAFGRWLARERELRGLAREVVGRVTRLAPGIVEALESGDHARTPPRAYALGYLRAYAAAVGLDPDEVVLRFEEASGGPSVGPQPQRRQGGPVRVILAVLVAAAVAGAGVWALFGS